MKKAIVTVIGKDRTGIIANVSAKLFEANVNILDISQTVLQEYFSMVALVDVSEAGCSFAELKQALGELGESIGMSIRIQHEDIFNSMHRI